MKTPRPFDLKFIENFVYDETSVSGLSLAKNGKHIGYINKDKNGRPVSVSVYFSGIQKAANRVIWEIFNGAIPEGYVIDHLDGNPLNNKISNLSCKPKRANEQNKRMETANTSGVVGVKWICVANKFTYAVAFYSDENCKYIQKNFSVKKLGLLPAFYEACCWRKESIEKLNSSGAMYTQRHIGI